MAASAAEGLASTGGDGARGYSAAQPHCRAERSTLCRVLGLPQATLGWSPAAVPRACPDAGHSRARAVLMACLGTGSLPWLRPSRA